MAKEIIMSPFETCGAGRGRLNFDKPRVVQGLVMGRSKEVRPGLTNGQEIAENANNLLDLKEGQILLDLGCGPGLISRYLQPKLGPNGWLYCVDASIPMLKEAEKVVSAENTSLIYGDIHVVDRLIPEKADAALLSGNVHLLTNRSLAFKAIWDTLKQEGKLLIICHAYSTGVNNDTNRFASIVDGLRESRKDLFVDGLRLPLLSSKEIGDISSVLVKSGFGVSFYEKDSFASDLNELFGYPPTKTIEDRLEAIYKEDARVTPEQIKSFANFTMSEINKGNAAQLYILCKKIGVSASVNGSYKHTVKK